MKLTAEHRATIRDRADCMRYDHIPQERSMGVMVMALLDDFAEMQSAAVGKGHQANCPWWKEEDPRPCDCILSTISR